MRILPVVLLLLVEFFFATGCLKPKQKKDASLFTQVSPTVSRITFRNDVYEDSTWNGLLYNYGYNGGGVAAGDLNNDGLPELIFIANQKGPTVYLNKGEMHFEDITRECGVFDSSGWYTGVTLVDVNSDGWLDIYFSKSGNTAGKIRENKLYINLKNSTFSEQGEKMGLNDSSPSTHAVFFDYDLDDDLDCYIVNHPQDFKEILNPFAFSDTSILPTGQDKMMENVNGFFQDVTQQSGLTHTFGYGLSVSTSDVNADGFPDLFVANDYASNDQLFINNGNKTFTERTTQYFSHTSLFSMGSDFGDINNDGLQDLLVVDMKPDNHYRIKNNLVTPPNEFYYYFLDRFPPQQKIKNVLQVATSENNFFETSQMAGVDKTDWSWGALIQDFDNDGWNDIHITNGTKRDLHDLDFMMLNDAPDRPEGFSHDTSTLYLKMPVTLLRDYAFKNEGDFQFQDVSATWGLDAASVSNGSAYADLDLDGDLDLVVNNTDSIAFIFQNNSEKLISNHFLRIRLQGKGQNTFALGSKVEIFYNNQKQVKELQNGRGFQSCSEPILHFGLGGNTHVDSAHVYWHGGGMTTLINIQADQLLSVTYSDSSFVPSQPKEVFKTQLSASKIPGLEFHHRESSYNDFKTERLLPYQLSKEGPGIAIADVNGDGLDDILFTNGYNSRAPDTTIQRLAGSLKNQPASKERDAFLGGLQASAKNTSDFRSSPSLYLQHRDKTFSLSTENFFTAHNTETLGAAFFDADNDGDMDLYLATGSNEFTPWDEALADHFFLNDGKGHFLPADERIPKILASNSCVITTDFDRDGDEDIFVGGRLTPKYFPSPGRSSLLRNENGYFTDVTQKIAPGLENVGMVNAAVFSDFNNDGTSDLILCGDWMPVTVFRNTGNKFEQATDDSVLNNMRGLWKSISAGDFDNDGDMDYLLGNLGLNSFLKATPTEPIEILYNDFDGNSVKEPLLFHYLKKQRAPLADRGTFGEQMPKFRNTFLTFKSYAAYDWDSFFVAQKKQSAYFFATELASGILVNQGNGKFLFNPLPGQAQVSPVFGTCLFDFNNDGNLDILLQGNWFSNHFSNSQFDAGRGLMLLGDGSGRFLPRLSDKSGFFQAGDAKSLSLLNSSAGTPLFISTANSAAINCYTLQDSTERFSLKISADEIYAQLMMQDGRIQKMEFRNTLGYLSQPSSTVFLPRSTRTAKIFKGNGSSREVTF